MSRLYRKTHISHSKLWKNNNIIIILATGAKYINNKTRKKVTEDWIKSTNKKGLDAQKLLDTAKKIIELFL